MVLAVTLGAAGLFLYRWTLLHGDWQPVSAHVDGLLLIATLIGGLVLYVQARPGVTGFAAFALPVLALILAWAICANHFTYRPFDMNTLHPLWQVLHLAAVYAGTALAAVAAVAGAMYLYLQRRLKRRRTPIAPGGNPVHGPPSNQPTPTPPPAAPRASPARARPRGSPPRPRGPG